MKTICTIIKAVDYTLKKKKSDYDCDDTYRIWKEIQLNKMTP